MASTSNIQGPWAVGTNYAPRYPGLYFVYAEVQFEKPRLLYIGESTNIASRMAGHDRREDWEREARSQLLVFYAMRIESIFERLRLERELIGRFSPPCNVQFNSKARSSSSDIGNQFGALSSLMGGSVKSDPFSAVSAFGSLARKGMTKERSHAYGLGSLMGGSVKSDPPSATSALASLCRDEFRNRS